jgi:hypothetical protein
MVLVRPPFILCSGLGQQELQRHVSDPAARLPDTGKRHSGRSGEVDVVIPVLAGPVEATAVGNLLVQASTGGALRGDLETLRALIRKTHEPLRYEPRPKRRAG